MAVPAIATLAQAFPSVDQNVWQAIQDVRWTDWSGFWLRYLLSDRYMVCFFLALVPLLLFVPRRHLRTGIIVSSLVFLAYIFGAAYPLVWLVMCVAFFYLGERFVIEAKRTDVVRWGPPLAAILCIGGWYLGAMLLGLVHVTRDNNDLLFEHCPWLFPLIVRAGFFEGDHPPQWFTLFFVVQLNGIVIFVIRMIHYFSELKRDTIPPAQRTLTNFLAFASFAPTVMQGPIERFADFQKGLAHCHERRTPRDMLYGLYRIGMGLVKNLFLLLVVRPPLARLLVDQGYFTQPERAESYVLLFFCVHFLVFHLYIEFSGYCDIAIGLARLLGYRAAENFNKPWLATNLTDIWRRWHITLSFICRDYIFMPMVRRRWSPVTSLVVTFLIVGALHNMNPSYLLWGAVMGLMVAVNHKWTRWMRDLDRAPERRLSKIRRFWLKLRPLPTLCAWALTMNAFVFSGLILAWTLERWYGCWIAWELIRRPALWIGRACGLDWPESP